MDAVQDDWRTRGNALWKTIPVPELQTAAGKPHHVRERLLRRYARVVDTYHVIMTPHSNASQEESTPLSHAQPDSTCPKMRSVRLELVRARRVDQEQGRLTALAQRMYESDTWLAEHRLQQSRALQAAALRRRERAARVRANKANAHNSHDLAISHTQHMIDACNRRAEMLQARAEAVQAHLQHVDHVRREIEQQQAHSSIGRTEPDDVTCTRAAGAIQRWWRTCMLLRAVVAVRTTPLWTHGTALGQVSFEAATTLLQSRGVLRAVANVLTRLAALDMHRATPTQHRVLLAGLMMAHRPGDVFDGSDADTEQGMHALATKLEAALRTWLGRPSGLTLARFVQHWTAFARAFRAWRDGDVGHLAATLAAEHAQLEQLKSTVQKRLHDDEIRDWLAAIEVQQHALLVRMAKLGVSHQAPGTAHHVPSSSDGESTDDEARRSTKVSVSEANEGRYVTPPRVPRERVPSPRMEDVMADAQVRQCMHTQ